MTPSSTLWIKKQCWWFAFPKHNILKSKKMCLCKPCHRFVPELPILHSWERPRPRTRCRGRNSPPHFVNKGRLKQRAKTKLNTPSRVYCWLRGESSYVWQWHQRCQTFHFAGESWCNTRPWKERKGKHTVGAVRWVNEKPGWNQESSSIVTLPTTYFSRQPHLHCFSNSSRFPLPSSTPFSCYFLPGLPSLW